MPAETKVQENRVRNRLRRQGYRLSRSSERDPRAASYDCYAILEGQGEGVALGGYGGFTSPYTLSLDECEAWALLRS